MKLFKITKAGKIAFVLAFFLAFLISSKVHALESTVSANSPQKYGITFPVSELGNCANVNACKTYCNDPVNRDACQEFAKKKGLVKPSQNALKNSLIIAAKQELGCESEAACKQLCSLTENREKCASFAKSHNLTAGKPEELAKQDILSKAKQILGCESVENCKALCQKEENKDKCAEFAKKAGLKGGEVKVGPGGCTTKESCISYCSDSSHAEECRKFGLTMPQKPPMYEGRPMKEGSAPAGMNKEELCRQNPEKCKEMLQRQQSSKKPAAPFFGRPEKAFQGSESAKFAPGVRGISAVRGLFDRLLDIFN